MNKMLASATHKIDPCAAARFCVRCAVCKSLSLHFEDYFVEKIHGQVIAGRSAVVHCSPHAFTVLIIGVLEQFIILGLPQAAVLDNIVCQQMTGTVALAVPFLPRRASVWIVTDNRDQDHRRL